MQSSKSQRALKALLDAKTTEDPDQERKRTAVKAVCNRSLLWSYATGQKVPGAERAADIETASEGDIPANGWKSDSAAPEGAPCSAA